ncbi:MAG: hypothetical protein BWX88_05097 [Planctomycetes bacterium ADurb.Bin126]|nr:MAG: hypothetical protein BWX88_05097 [Planctomycetes bacterium ADurb.Bin126]HOD84734.1 hypothetical protein [Phycisphaerae bacterium]
MNQARPTAAKLTPTSMRAIGKSYERLRAAGKAYRAAHWDETLTSTRLARRLYRLENARHAGLLRSLHIYGSARPKAS